MLFRSDKGEFWKLASLFEGRLQTEGCFHFIMLDFSHNMKILERTRTERYTDMLRREGSNLTVVVSGPMYDIPRALEPLAAIAPLPPSQTTTEGKAVDNGRVVEGIAQPQRFYFAKLALPSPRGHFWGYVAGGPGDPPSYVSSAVGGAGPLIINRLPYGPENGYANGFKGPKAGDPGPALRSHLVQRSSSHFASIAKYPLQAGKVVLAACTVKRKLLVGVQPNNEKPGMAYSDIAWGLADKGFDNAVFLDGSSSATMMVRGKFVAQPTRYKDDADNIAVGFYG